jgi:stress-induced morphogen
MQQYKTSSLVRRQKRWAIYRHGGHYWIKYNSKEFNAKYRVKLKHSIYHLLKNFNSHSLPF